MKIKYKTQNKTKKRKKSIILFNFYFFLLLFSFYFLVLPTDDSSAGQKEVITKLTAAQIPAIYSRTDWSSSKDDKRAKKIWPAQFEDPEMIIVHHTATSYKSSTVKQIKKINRYHSYTRRWGDIGYNYIIGQDGMIFEGRYGGNGAIGGHSYYNKTNYNSGSIGIAVLGDYQKKELSSASLESLEKLVGWLAATNGIDISADAEFFSKKFSSAVIGHKDVADTDCPGKNISSEMSAIRSAGRSFSSAYEDYAYKVSGKSGVFEIRSGKRYSDSSKQPVVEIAQNQMEAYPLAGAAEKSEESDSSLPAFPSGTLVRLDADGQMGIVEGGLLKPIPNSSVLAAGYISENAVAVSQEKWNEYTAGEKVGYRSGAVLKSGSDYFAISGNAKRKINLAADQRGLINLADVAEAETGEFASFQEGLEISEISDFPEGTIMTTNFKNYYVIGESKTKKKITKDVFRASFGRQMALEVSRKALKLYRTTGNLSFQNGAVVKRQGKYYFIENNLRRKFSSKKTLDSMGYKNIVKATRTGLQGIGSGEDIK